MARGRKPKYTDADRRHAAEMRRAGLRWRQIGAALGCHKATALRLAREYEPAPSSNGQAPTRPTDELAIRDYQTPVPTL